MTPDGFFIISACLDGKPMLRNGQTGDWIGTFIGHKGAVWAVALNSLATRAATGSADYTAKVWDSVTGEALLSFEHKRIVKTVSFSPDDKKVLTGGQEKMLRLFSLEKPEAEPFCFGEEGSYKSTLWLSDHLVISVAAENCIRLWDVRTGGEVQKVPTKSNVSSIELSRDSSTLTTTIGKEVVFFEPERLQVVKSYTLPVELNSASLAPPASQSILPDGPRFVAGGLNFWVYVHDYQTGKELEVHKGHHGPVHCLRFAPDGETYASGSEDGTIRLWQTTIKPYGLWQYVGSQEDKEDDGKETKENKE
jgi:serine-threonine kinase receptor-associated protein